MLGAADGSVVKNICSYRRLRFDSQHPHGRSQPSVTLVLKCLLPFSDLCGQWACTWCTSIHIKTLIYNIKKRTQVIWVWWHTPLTPALGKKRQKNLWVWSLPSVHSVHPRPARQYSKSCFKQKQRRYTIKQKHMLLCITHLYELLM